MNISKHAKTCFKERCGFKKKTSKRMVEKAFSEEITHKKMIK